MTKFDKIETFILNRISKKRKKAYAIAENIAIALMTLLGVILLILTIIRYTHETAFMGILFVSVGIICFFIQKYKSIIKKLLADKKTDQ